MAMPNAVLAGPDDPSAPPGCSDEEQHALARLTATSTLADPQTIVALLGASVQDFDFDSEAMALTELAGAVAITVAEADEECVVAIRPRNATNVTLAFTSFGLGSFGYLRVFDGLNTAAPLLATLTGDELPQAVTSQTSAMLLVLTRDPNFDGAGFTAMYRADTVTLEPSGGLPAASVAASACVAAKQPVSHMCRQCILATIASVCGSRCAQERLHIIHDGPAPLPSGCLPSLALQLAVGQVGRLEGAFLQREPFGFSSELPVTGPNLTDLYMPAIGLGGPSTQPVVYVGLDSGNRIVRCDLASFPALMVVTHSTEPSDCTGFAWLDLRTGQARLQLHPPSDVETVPFVIHDIPRECSAVLRSPPPVVGGVLVFAGGADVRSVGCWLMRFFGPQAASESMRLSQIDFAGGLPTIHLVSDLVVRAGQRVSLSGDGGSLRIGKQQVQVHPGGSLETLRLAIAESEDSSAVVVEGVAAFTNSTFVGCSARLNAVSERGLESHGGAIAVIGGGRLWMQHCSMRRNAVRDGVECSGGALLVSASSSAELDETELSGNIAIGGRVGSNGGAACVRASSSLKLVRSTLAQNVANGKNGTSLYANGGAVCFQNNSVGEVHASEIVKNLARDALAGPSGGAFFVDYSRLTLAMSTINLNIAEGGVYNPVGGAIYVYTSVAEIADCELLENLVRGGAYANGGTGPKICRALRSMAIVCYMRTDRSSRRGSIHFFCLETEYEPLVGPPEQSRGRR
jgi:hypothetical protein